MKNDETLTHKLVLPTDANHHGTLYAGSLLRIALESAYATAVRFVGNEANILLRRVLGVECYLPVPMGTVIEIRGRPLHVTRAYLVIGLIATPMQPNEKPWMDGLMGFVQIDDRGQPTPFQQELNVMPATDSDWSELSARMSKLLRIRQRKTTS